MEKLSDYCFQDIDIPQFAPAGVSTHDAARQPGIQSLEAHAMTVL
jgi:hypothetical protein